jgi:uncharacterized protein (TIGR02147 family)
MEMLNHNIYDYESPRQFLLDRVNEMQKAEPALSIRALAQRCGDISHTLLIMLLQGKRPLHVKHATVLARGLKLTSAERIYFQALVQFDSAQDLEEKKLCSLWLADLHPTGAPRQRRLDEFELVSNWFHMAILAASEVEGFEASPEAIAKRFGHKLTATEVRSALERLASLKLIEYTADGKFRPTHNSITTADDVASAGARKYHKQVMSLAAEALEAAPLERREFQSMAISIPESKIGLAKDMIRKFRAQFENAMGGEKLDHVYQFNIQFFQLTENPARMGRTEGEGVDTQHPPQGKVP